MKNCSCSLSLKGLYNATRPLDMIGLIHLPSLLWCEAKLVQYLLAQNKAFQATVSEKHGHVQPLSLLKSESNVSFKNVAKAVNLTTDVRAVNLGRILKTVILNI